MNTLIYKRTHRGDPNESGVFGCHNCMGRIRRWNFDAVIGVGGKRPWPKDMDIACKINWIGIGASRNFTELPNQEHPVVTFKHFCLYEERGLELKSEAFNLYEYMFVKQNVRAVLSQSLDHDDLIQRDISKILMLAEGCPPSKVSFSDKPSQRNCKQQSSRCCK